MSNNLSKNISKNFRFCTLNKADIGAVYKIVSCNLSEPLQTRFYELGFVAGVNVSVIKRAPLGDPIEISLLGYSICVRTNEAKHITVERLADE